MGGFYFPQFDSLYEDEERVPIQDSDAYLDPNDPDIESLRNLYSKPSGAQSLYRNYLSRRPTYERPSGGQLLINSLVGVIQSKGDPRAAAQIAQSLGREKYERLYQQWVDEGKYVDDLGRLLEADKGREIKATEFGIRQRMAGRKEEARQKALKVTQDQRTAALEETARKNREAEIDRDLTRKSIESQRGILNELAKARLEESKASGERANATLNDRRLTTEKKLEQEAFDEAHDEVMKENADLFRWEDKSGKALEEPVFIGNTRQKGLLDSIRKAKKARILNKKLKRLYPHDILPEEGER